MVPFFNAINNDQIKKVSNELFEYHLKVQHYDSADYYYKIQHKGSSNYQSNRKEFWLKNAKSAIINKNFNEAGEIYEVINQVYEKPENKETAFTQFVRDLLQYATTCDYIAYMKSIGKADIAYENIVNNTISGTDYIFKRGTYAISKNQKYTAISNDSLTIYDIDSDKTFVTDITINKGDEVYFSANNQLLCVFNKHMLIVCEIPSLNKKYEMKTPDNVTINKISPNFNSLYVNNNGKNEFWDYNQQKIANDIDGTFWHFVSDDKVVYTTLKNEKIEVVLHNITNSNSLSRIATKYNKINSLNTSTFGNYIAFTGDDNSLQLWDLKNQVKKFVQPGYKFNRNNLVFSNLEDLFIFSEKKELGTSLSVAHILKIVDLQKKQIIDSVYFYRTDKVSLFNNKKSLILKSKYNTFHKHEVFKEANTISLLKAAKLSDMKIDSLISAKYLSNKNYKQFELYLTKRGKSKAEIYSPILTKLINKDYPQDSEIDYYLKKADKGTIQILSAKIGDRYMKKGYYLPAKKYYEQANMKKQVSWLKAWLDIYNKVERASKYGGYIHQDFIDEKVFLAINKAEFLSWIIKVIDSESAKALRDYNTAKFSNLNTLIPMMINATKKFK